MKAWPHVVGEEESLWRVLSGMSVARYGDGELNLCLGHGIKSQAFDATLARRLRAILFDSARCAVAIPNLLSKTKPFWERFQQERYVKLLNHKRVYLSAFISRPDSAPWIHTPEYWSHVEDLWRGQDVTLVRGSDKSLTPTMLASAKSVREVRCASQHAWRDYPKLLAKVGTPKRALLCCGPTATVMAVDLCERGVHAIDLGHVGMWMRRLHLSPDAALAEARLES
jgi:hypothetical protein